jgi:hypothetical protein
MFVLCPIHLTFCTRTDLPENGVPVRLVRPRARGIHCADIHLCRRTRVRVGSGRVRCAPTHRRHHQPQCTTAGYHFTVHIKTGVIISFYRNHQLVLVAAQ